MSDLRWVQVAVKFTAPLLQAGRIQVSSGVQVTHPHQYSTMSDAIVVPHVII